MHIFTPVRIYTSQSIPIAGDKLPRKEDFLDMFSIFRVNYHQLTSNIQQLLYLGVFSCGTGLLGETFVTTAEAHRGGGACGA